MIDRSRILVVAATARELAAPDGWHALRCGVGPVDAAAATMSTIASLRPAAILHVGIAGARRRCGLAPASLVIGTEAHYDDLDVPAEWSPRAVRAFPEAPQLRIGTSARVGGTSDCDVEAMEGFAVLRAAELAGVPAVEVRAIANEIEETDRARWHFDAAFAAITAATPRLVEEIARCVR
jgi:futalosine hydrolase